MSTDENNQLQPATTPATPTPDTATVEQLAAKDAEIEQLRAQLAEAEAAVVTTPAAPVATAAVNPATGVAPATASIGVAPATVAQAPAEEVGVQTPHAIAPGSTGPDVRNLAQLLEQAGERTYLTDPTAQNPADVFDDSLMEAVRRVLHDHPEIAAAENAERQRLNRWIGGLELVTAEVWRLIGDVADSNTKATTSA